MRAKPSLASERDLTIAGWCAKRRWSLSKFFNLQKQNKGLTPVVLRPPGCREGLITAQADHDWEVRMLKLGKSEAARKEAERRTAQARVAGRKAVKSDLHISKRGKR
jgi:hypothetical protein